MVRLAIGSIAGIAEFNLDEIEDIKTAVGEACKNISCHGHEGFAEEYTLECETEKNYLEIRVTDTGCNHNIKKDCKICSDCPNEGDLGIFIIKSLMSEVEIVANPEGKKTIKMIKRK